MIPLSFMGRPSWRKSGEEAAAARDKGFPTKWQLPVDATLPVDSTGLLKFWGILSPTELETYATQRQRLPTRSPEIIHSRSCHIGLLQIGRHCSTSRQLPLSPA